MEVVVAQSRKLTSGLAPLPYQGHSPLSPFTSTTSSRLKVHTYCTGGLVVVQMTCKPGRMKGELLAPFLPSPSPTLSLSGPVGPLRPQSQCATLDWSAPLLLVHHDGHPPSVSILIWTQTTQIIRPLLGVHSFNTSQGVSCDDQTSIPRALTMTKPYRPLNQ